MGTRLFGRFLLERSALSWPQLLDGCRHRDGQRMPLAALTLARGLLSPLQIELLDAERAESDLDIMEIAIRKDVLTFEQLQKLSKIPTEPWMFLADALARNGGITLVRLAALMADFSTLPPSDAPTLRDRLGRVPEKDAVTAFVQATTDTFLQYPRLLVDVVSDHDIPEEPDDLVYVFARHLPAQNRMTVAWALPEPLTLAVANSEQRETSSGITAAALDAASQFVNKICDAGRQGSDAKRTAVTADPPHVMIRSVLQEAVERTAVIVRLRTADAPFRLLFFFGDAARNLPW